MGLLSPFFEVESMGAKEDFLKALEFDDTSDGFSFEVRGRVNGESDGDAKFGAKESSN